MFEAELFAQARCLYSPTSNTLQALVDRTHGCNPTPEWFVRVHVMREDRKPLYQLLPHIVPDHVHTVNGNAPTPQDMQAFILPELGRQALRLEEAKVKGTEITSVRPLTTSLR